MTQNISSYQTYTHLSNVELVKHGVAVEQSAKQIALECIARSNRAGDTITIWLQDQVREIYSDVIGRDSNNVLHKGYQNWKGTNYHQEFNFVNRVQARARQLAKAAKEAADKAKNPAPPVVTTTSTDDKAAKLAAESATRKAVAELDDVKQVAKERGRTIAELEAEIASLKQQLAGKDNHISRLEREITGNVETYNRLADAIKDNKLSRKQLVAMI